MKRIAFGVLIALIAASPAAAAKKTKRIAAQPVASTNPNENGWRFFRDSLPIYLPAWSMPFYMAAQQQQQKPAKR